MQYLVEKNMKKEKQTSESGIFKFTQSVTFLGKRDNELSMIKFLIMVIFRVGSKNRILRFQRIQLSVGILLTSLVHFCPIQVVKFLFIPTVLHSK